MRSLQVTCFVAGMIALSASPLSAQAGRMSCKDGTPAKVGHFSCWGHGGVVAGPAKSTARSAAKAEAKATAKSAKKGPDTKAKKKASARKPHATVTKAGRKPHAKKAVKTGAR
jgi:hypothetical protein